MAFAGHGLSRSQITRHIPALVASAVLFFSAPATTSYAAPLGPAAKPEPVRIGVSSMVTPVDAVKYYQEIIDYIGERIGMPVRMVHRRTYEEMDRLLERGEVSVAFICSASYVKDREKFGVELLAAPSVNGRPKYHSYIIVRNDSHIKAFGELKGGAFAFTDPRSNSGTIYPTYLLKTMGYEPEGFFKRLAYSYSHNKSVEMVAKRIVDGAAVDSLVYDYMLKTGSLYAKQTKVIKRSPPYGTPPVVAARGVPPALKAGIRNALLDMSMTERGMKVLKSMMIDGFVEVSDGIYDGIREMDRAIAGIGRVARKPWKGNIVRIGVIPWDNPRITYEKYQPLVDYLSRKTPYAYELMLSRHYEETVDQLAGGDTDFAFLGPLTYLEARARFGAVCVLKPRGSDGTGQYRSVIIKRKDSAITATSDLKGKTIAFSSSKSTSGNLVPRYLLANEGIHLNDLKEYSNFHFHDSVVKAVLKGKYDAGAVRDSVARKYVAQGIEILAESGTIPTGPLVARPGVSPKVLASVREALGSLNPANEDDRKVLRRLDEDLRNGFTKASDTEYEGIRRKFNEVPAACGLRCHPRIRL